MGTLKDAVHFGKFLEHWFVCVHVCMCLACACAWRVHVLGKCMYLARSPKNLPKCTYTNQCSPKNLPKCTVPLMYPCVLI